MAYSFAGAIPAEPARGDVYTDDLHADYERLKARGAEFTLPPTDVTGSRIAALNDNCGNRLQLTQLL